MVLEVEKYVSDHAEPERLMKNCYIEDNAAS